MLTSANTPHSRRDHRTRSDRVRIQTQKWNDQMPKLTTAFVNWTAGINPNLGAMDSSEKSWKFPVYSFESTLTYVRAVSSLKSLHTGFETRSFIHEETSESINETLVVNGVLGCSPDSPTIGFTLHFLECFRQLHRVCPQLTISGIATSLQHIHKVASLYEIRDSILHSINTRSH